MRRLFGGSGEADAQATPISAARIAIIRSLSGGWGWDEGSNVDPLAAYGPVILAWRSGETLDIDVGVAADHVGDTLYLLPVRIAASGPVSFRGGTVQQSILEIDATEGWSDGSALYIGRGTMTVAYRPAGLEGSFEVTGLSVRLGERRQIPAEDGEDIAVLPDGEQPDQDDPLGTDVVAATGGIPRIQLFDRGAGRWIEFQPLTVSRTYRIVDPERYVDGSGTFNVRFVNRAAGESSSFVLGVRLDGTVP